MAPDRALLGIVLAGGAHAPAHAAFSFAAAAAAMGRRVVLFATAGGVRALCRDWSGLAGAGRDALLTGRGLAGLDELREAALALEARLVACEAALRGEGIGPDALLAGVAAGGIVSFLEEIGGGQLLSF